MYNAGSEYWKHRSDQNAVHVLVRVLGARVVFVACFCVGEEYGTCALVFAPAAACRVGAEPEEYRSGL